LGWYNNHNLGDERFKPSIQKVLGPDVDIDFVNHITNLDNYDAIIIGGGSFLDQPLPIYVPQLIDPTMVSIPIIFLGVGIHNTIHPNNKAWLEKAKLIVCRNIYGCHINDPKLLYGPDLYFADIAPLMRGSEKKHLLILPNGFTVPRSNSEEWQRGAWYRFEEVMGSIIDNYSNQGWEVTLTPMAGHPSKLYHYDDRQASFRLAQAAKDPHLLIVQQEVPRYTNLLAEIARSQLVLTARYHGAIFATAMHVPFVGISSHDKMKSYFIDNQWNNYVDYYTFTKDDLDKAIQSIPSNRELIHTYEKGYTRWQELAAIVRDKLYS
jgi:polysaccharide pyruvyl transferase WcaK-like protein